MRLPRRPTGYGPVRCPRFKIKNARGAVSFCRLAIKKRFWRDPLKRAFGKPNRLGTLPGGGHLNAREPVQRSPFLGSAGPARRRNWGVQVREMASQNETQTLKAGFLIGFHSGNALDRESNDKNGRSLISRSDFGVQRGRKRLCFIGKIAGNGNRTHF